MYFKIANYEYSPLNPCQCQARSELFCAVFWDVTCALTERCTRAQPPPHPSRKAVIFMSMLWPSFSMECSSITCGMSYCKFWVPEKKKTHLWRQQTNIFTLHFLQFLSWRGLATFKVTGKEISILQTTLRAEQSWINKKKNADATHC
jgi:hypothetical protein